MRHEDEHLQYWGDRFVSAGLRACGTFDEFMRLSPQLRERRLFGAQSAQALQERIERRLPGAVLRNGVLIEPVHPVSREHRHPWWYRVWRKVSRVHGRRGFSRHAS